MVISFILWKRYIYVFRAIHVLPERHQQRKGTEGHLIGIEEVSKGCEKPRHNKRKHVGKFIPFVKIFCQAHLYMYN